MKLKTLKDLENGFKVVGVRELKQEAIKWVKEDFEELKTKDIPADDIVRVWMYRFNLTEEDLKEIKK